MLMTILGAKFTDDVLGDIEAWERLIRDFEAQSTHMIPDFIKCGVLTQGMTDPAIKDHLVMHSARLTTYDLMQREVADILRSRQALNGPTPMQVDALTKAGKPKGAKGGPKGKGKGKGEDGQKGKGKYDWSKSKYGWSKGKYDWKGGTKGEEGKSSTKTPWIKCH